jgi:hypothetical protein
MTITITPEREFDLEARTSGLMAAGMQASSLQRRTGV